MKTKINLLAVFLLPLLCCSAWAATPVRVVGVSDGDTIRVITADSKQIKIRLHGIDAPEDGQAYGKVSTKGLRSLLAGRQVSIEPTGSDRYGRTVALVYADGLNVNEAMVSNGWAWVYPQYCTQSFCSKWIQAESIAKASKSGLWREWSVLPPWEWRAQQKAQQIAPANTASSPQRYAAGSSGGSFSGNVKSGVFHRPSYKHYRCKNCTKSFSSRQQALDAGYKPCGNCKP